jgi:hypothetical protein
MGRSKYHGQLRADWRDLPTSNFLAQLTKRERARLLEELNYMSLEEIRGFCSTRGLPYKIVAEYPDGKVKATKDTDQKPIVLARVVATSPRARPASLLASPRRLSVRSVRQRGSNLATVSTIAGTRKSSRVSCGCCAT